MGPQKLTDRPSFTALAKGAVVSTLTTARKSARISLAATGATTSGKSRSKPPGKFHVRGRKATLELAGQMNLGANSHGLDIGSGLGGPARTVAEAHGCRVTGIDVTHAFCEAATVMSDWVGWPRRRGPALISKQAT